MANLVKQLLQPVAVVWIALIIMCIWQIYRYQYRWAFLNGLIIFALFLFGCTPLSNYLLWTLERSYVCENLDKLPTADAVIVLGGIVSDSPLEPTGFGVGSAIDRILTGVELVRLGKASHLAIGGGSKHAVLKSWIERWELVDVPVIHPGGCNSTREEADQFASMMEDEKWETVILVTSAWHMRRSEAVFRTAGVEVIPVGCDFRDYSQNQTVSYGVRYTLVPQSDSLNSLRIYLYERIGWVYYCLRGWIKPIKSIQTETQTHF